ncbi:MAG: type VI secretion system baseplate subunit TssF [Bacteroidales bacterium]|nr:type VI secretion system baseplate subunit TssF [Bacteroidales bacterium]
MENRNDIKKRMMAVAAKTWGLSSREMESIDPLIPLLIEANAAELEKVSGSVDEAGQRMAAKLMEMLTPENLLNPAPAMGILQALPFDPTGSIDEDNQFYYFKRNPFEDGEADLEIFFTPVAEHRLFNGKVDFIASGNTLSRTEEMGEKRVVAKNAYGRNLSNELWIGVSLHKSVRSPEGLSFYFETENLSDSEERVFYQALQKAQWEINGTAIETKPGYYDKDSTLRGRKITFPHTDFNRSHTVSQHVLDFYRKHFVSVANNPWDSIISQDAYLKYPDEFQKIFHPDDLKPLTNRLLWFKIRFLPHIPGHIPDRVRCSINCFPVINRRKEKSVISGLDRIKELRLNPYEVFFDLAEIHCDSKLQVIVGDQLPADMEGKALLTLRKDNIGRFNTTNAVEKIQQMIDAYRNDYPAFAKIKGIDHETIDKLYDAIKPFEHATDHLQDFASGTTPYLMLRTDAGKESAEVEVSYYLTCGSLGNGIMKGMHINYESAELLRDRILLMTTTMGGTDRKKDEELIRSFRYALLTRGKIVTMEDIRALTEAQFGRFAESIDVKKGAAMSPDYGSGLQRVIEITVRLKRDSQLTPEEIKYLKDDLEQQLVERSTNVMPFRVVCS